MIMAAQLLHWPWLPHEFVHHTTQDPKRYTMIHKNQRSKTAKTVQYLVYIILAHTPEMLIITMKAYYLLQRKPELKSSKPDTNWIIGQLTQLITLGCVRDGHRSGMTVPQLEGCHHKSANIYVTDIRSTVRTIKSTSESPADLDRPPNNGGEDSPTPDITILTNCIAQSLS